MEKETKKTVNDVKDDVKQAAQNGREEIAKAALTTKQKVMIGATVVAATGAGFAAGYVVGKRRKKDNPSEEVSETKELE